MSASTLAATHLILTYLHHVVPARVSCRFQTYRSYSATFNISSQTLLTLPILLVLFAPAGVHTIKLFAHGVKFATAELSYY
ncbi:hypothetical protein F5B17DRAFT_259932 [Nemania serpens]|nr:hypothetical protein F5B17DRAFT_259932 [Nemania serpens]